MDIISRIYKGLLELNALGIDQFRQLVRVACVTLKLSARRRVALPRGQGDLFVDFATTDLQRSEILELKLLESTQVLDEPALSSESFRHKSEFAQFPRSQQARSKVGRRYGS